MGRGLFISHGRHIIRNEASSIQFQVYMYVE